MKLIILIILISLLNSLCYSQNEKNEKLTGYLELLSENQGKSISNYIAMDDSEFKRAVKIAYEAIEAASSDLLTITRADTGVRNSQGRLIRSISKRYSEVETAIVRIPIFLKAKILSSEDVIDHGFRQINLTMEPEFILKGKEPFLKKTSFVVYYRRYNSVPDSLDYKIGKSYLFPLWDRGEGEDIFSVATWVSGDGSRFLIEDNTLHDENNFFEMGQKVDWSEFILHFNSMISKISSLN